MTDYKVGQLVELNDGRTAIVCFVGQTNFSGGDWVGVSFDEPSGKNDGSVKGERYFECDPGHGMFLRPTGIGKVLEEPTPKPTAKKPAVTGKTPGTGATGPAAKSRPSSIMANGLRRPGNDPAAPKRQSINAPSPSPGPRASVGGRKSPTKLATRAVGSAATSTVTSRGATPPATASRRNPTTVANTRPTTTGRPSIQGTRTESSSATSTARPTRPSISGTTRSVGGRATTTGPHTRNASIPPRQTRPSPAPAPRMANGIVKQEKSPDPPTESSVEPELFSEDTTSPQQSPNSSDIGHDTPSSNFAPAAPQTAFSPTREAALKGLPHAAPTSRHIQDLETKIRTYEKQAEEYREKLSGLEKLESEKNRYLGVVEKLQAKLQPQSQELADLRRQLKESQSKLDAAESKDEDHETTLEAALLDREAAEVERELAQSELNALKDKLEELKLDVDVLREENEALNQDVTPEERQSQSWLHRERENERLREALMRLRDISQDTEAELRLQIRELEHDLGQLQGMKEEYEDTKEKLQASEALVNDLKEQLDEALDAENTTERLTAENMALQDQMEQLRISIQELEDLKELNDELEYNHIEAEKQMQDELDFKNSLIIEQKRQTSEQDEKLADYEYTINKFRELVSNLQSHLEDMRASQQITEAEAEELNNRSKAMTDLNRKLHMSAEKAQINTIDLESRRLEAQEAIEHLAIVQLYLPDSFKTERESVLAYLRFRRVASKARLLHTLLKNKISGDNRQSGTEDIFALCDLLDKLVWIAATCDRFVNRISSCSLEDFVRFETAFYELEPVERGLNLYIENVKASELRENVAVEELQRTISLLSHLAEVHITGSEMADYAEDVIMRTNLMQNYLEHTATAMLLTRSTVTPEDADDDGDEAEDTLLQFSRDAQNFVSQVRSAKMIAAKANQALNDLTARSMSLDPTTSSTFTDAEDSAYNLSCLARKLGAHLRMALSSIENSTSDDSSSIRDATRTALRTFCSTNIPDTTSTDPLHVLSQKLKHTTALLSSILDLSSNLKGTTEFTRAPPPWEQRATLLKDAKQTTANTEAELIRMRDTLQSQSQQLRARDQSLEESNIKIELLESRTKDAAEKANRISELQVKLEEGRKRERDLVTQVEHGEVDTKTIAAERDHWKSQAASRRKSRASIGNETEAEEHIPDERTERANVTKSELEALRDEVQGLQGAVTYLRDENRRAKLARPDEPHMAWLQEPLFPSRMKSQREQERRSLQKQGKDAFAALRAVVAGSEGLVDLTLSIGVSAPDGTKLDRLRWRPMREKNSWKVARQKEQWVLWQAKAKDFVASGKDGVIRRPTPTPMSSRLSTGRTTPALNGHTKTAAVPTHSESLHSRGIGSEVGEQFHEASSDIGDKDDVGVAQ